MMIRDAKGRFERFDSVQNELFREHVVCECARLTHRDYALGAQSKRTKAFAAKRRKAQVVDDRSFAASRRFLGGVRLISRWIWPPSKGAAHGKVLDRPPPMRLRKKVIPTYNPMGFR